MRLIITKGNINILIFEEVAYGSRQTTADC